MVDKIVNFMIRTKFILLSVLILLVAGKVESLQAQTDNSGFKIEESSLSKKERRKQIPTYYGIAIGINNSKFRDFATSPLFYNGSALQVALSRLKIGNDRAAEFGFSYDFGSYTSNFNENITSSKVNRVELYYSQLYQVELLPSESFNTKVGFLLNSNGNLRTNEALQNNALGVDIFANLLGSIKLTKDISRKVTKEKRIWFFKYKLNERKRNLAFRLNLGLMNSSFRNGYVYTGQSSVLNNPQLFDGYNFNFFSGARASSNLDYTRYLKNKNAVRFSYVWDAYSTGGDLDKFEMAHHTLKFTLLFNTNNR